MSLPTTDLVITDTRLLGGDDARLDVGIGGAPNQRMVTFVDPAGGARPGEATIVDGSDWRLGPGLIDLQVNGGWGLDLTMDPPAVWEVGTELARLGVTAWLPTLVSAHLEVRREATEILKAGPPTDWVGAEPLGWHFEGPFLNPDRRGAHPLAAMRPVPPSVIDEPLPRLMTLAPELDGALDAITALSERGVLVSLGHTEAPAALVSRATAAGATMGTHLFNAMTGLTHRDPGTAAGLLESNAWLGLIADGHHVAPEMLRLVWRLASDRVVLVSDAMAGMGLEDGPTMLGSQPVVVADGTVRLADGTLAGSVLPLPEAVARFAEFTGIEFAEAAALASLHPANALGHTDRGAVAVGKRADLTIYEAASLDGPGKVISLGACLANQAGPASLVVSPETPFVVLPDR